MGKKAKSKKAAARARRTAARFGYPTDRFSAAIEQFDYAAVMDAVESYLSGIR